MTPLDAHERLRGLMLGRRLPGSLAALLLVLSASGCFDRGICDPEDLAASLASASEGQTVTIGACVVTGNFEVTGGVTIAGRNAKSAIASTEGGVALEVDLREGTKTRLVGLKVMSDGVAAIVASGPGDLEVTDVLVDVRIGSGLGVQDAGSLRLTRVVVQGPVSDATQDEISLIREEEAASRTGAHGLILIDVHDALFEEVTVSGMAVYGLVSVNSNLVWAGGRAVGNLRHGVFGYGGSAILDRVEINETRRGMQLVSVGAVFAGGISLITSGLLVADGEGEGVVHDNVDAIHESMTVTNNRGAGVWVQNNLLGFEMSGQGTLVSGNRLAAVAVLNSDDVRIQDARIESTAMASRVVGEMGQVRVGDGIHMVGASGVRIARVVLARNDRAGALIDLEGNRLEGSPFQQVTVEAEDEDALGVIVQGGEVAAGWDDGVERLGDLQSRDEGFLLDGARLEVLEAQEPDFVHPGWPLERGLDGLLGR